MSLEFSFLEVMSTVAKTRKGTKALNIDFKLMVIQQTVWWLKEKPTYTVVEMVEKYYFYFLPEFTQPKKNIINCVITELDVITACF